MQPSDPMTTVRDVLGRIQSAADERDVDAAAKLFADDAVLMGTADTSIGAAAIRDYLRLVFDQPGTIRWDWEDVRVQHEGTGLVAAACTGRVGFSDEPERDPFRLSLLLVETAQDWLILHFHGSIPAG
jgi:uncharacterized protein (TIGR02246 family)